MIAIKFSKMIFIRIFAFLFSADIVLGIAQFDLKVGYTFQKFNTSFIADTSIHCARQCIGMSMTGSASYHDRECTCHDKIFSSLTDAEEKKSALYIMPSLEGIVARDCNDLNRYGFDTNVYKIYPDGTSGTDALCDMDTDGGGWTVFQRRINGSEDFDKDWESYKWGFGDRSGEFWLGNEYLHQLTKRANYSLRVDLEDFEDNQTYAVYDRFFVASEANGYKLAVGRYSGDAGDAFSSQHGGRFSTFDRDNDQHQESCAEKYHGGWWFVKCHACHLNGEYLRGTHQYEAEGINWFNWRGHYYSLKKTTMMIRRK